MKPRILIAEDKPILAQDIMDRLEHFGYADLMGPFSSGEEAIVAAQDTPPDIALLDITLAGKMTGIELAQRLNSIKPTSIVYLSQHEDEHTFDQTLKTYPVAYINKPFTNNELQMAVLNAIKASNELSGEEKAPLENFQVLDDRIFIRNGRGKFYLMMNDIMWIQSGGGETSTIMTKDRLKVESKLLPLVGHNLSRLETKLEFYPYLVRCSRYYIVNLKAVDRIIDVSRGKAKKMLLIGENEIAVGDKYRKNVMDRFCIV